MYIGDAARVVEPLTGEGILYALQSGTLAADAISTAAANSLDPAVLYAQAAPKSVSAPTLGQPVGETGGPASEDLQSNSSAFSVCIPLPLKYLTSKVVRDGKEGEF